MTSPSTAPDIVDAVRAHIGRRAPLTDVCGLPLRPAPPATAAAVAAAEARIGFPLPPLLRRLYLEVANGGFGPGFGILGVSDDGHTDDEGRSIADLHAHLSAPNPGDPAWAWPAGHLAICDWGCATWSVLDCTRAEAPVVFAERAATEDDEDGDAEGDADEETLDADADDEDPGDERPEDADPQDDDDAAAAPPTGILWPSKPSLKAWLRAWLDGETLWRRRGAS